MRARMTMPRNDAQQSLQRHAPAQPVRQIRRPGMIIAIHKHGAWQQVGELPANRALTRGYRTVQPDHQHDLPWVSGG
jgi:hypothetical protein